MRAGHRRRTCRQRDRRRAIEHGDRPAAGVGRRRRLVRPRGRPRRPGPSPCRGRSGAAAPSGHLRPVTSFMLPAISRSGIVGLAEIPGCPLRVVGARSWLAVFLRKRQAAGLPGLALTAASRFGHGRVGAIRPRRGPCGRQRGRCGEPRRAFPAPCGVGADDRDWHGRCGPSGHRAWRPAPASAGMAPSVATIFADDHPRGRCSSWQATPTRPTTRPCGEHLAHRARSALLPRPRALASSSSRSSFVGLLGLSTSCPSCRRASSSSARLRRPRLGASLLASLVRLVFVVAVVVPLAWPSCPSRTDGRTARRPPIAKVLA